MSKNYKIYILSDSVGETAEMVARAAAEQFKGTNYEVKKFSYVSTKESIVQMIAEAKREEKVIVVFTTVLQELREKIVMECKKNDLPYIDILEPLMNKFSDLLKMEPINEPGIIHRLDEKYFKKVEAIEFAVKYDDGKDPRGIKKADIVLIGVSRTSKTPLSMYLAHKNVKVANVPLVPEVPIPDELYQIPTNRIIGLTTDPIKLNEIRQERLKALGLSNTATYANVDRILEELEYADKIMKKLQCPIINVSNKAVEETAGIILDLVKKQMK
ncbi:pyruvate, water dikinase regulatory protein [Fusibacter sp. JL216-2]|uniref:pyruvate, water dikinase regulatory protein n=1 Tax=Fusibacter sp. JL216-2 TaxID=3071453 RepID=UPI003D33849D